MPKINGLAEAVKILQELAQPEQERILLSIAKQDPKLAEKIKDNLITLEDLNYLTTSMIRDLFKELDPAVLGLSFRMASPKLIDHIFKNVSSGMKRDMEEVLKGKPRRVSEVQEATEKVLATVRKLIAEGKIVLKSDDKFV